MLEHNYARAIAACAPGKRVTITLASGRSIALPIVPEPAPIPPPDPLEVMSKQLLERDAETRASMEEIAARNGETLAVVKDAVEVIAEGQQKVVASIDENTRTLHLPVKPAYFPDGKLRHAKREEPNK